MADAAWVAELEKPENATMRQAPGDLSGIISKYNADDPGSGDVWRDAPQSEFFTSLQNDEWLSGLTDPETKAFVDTHTVSGSVMLTAGPTRAFLTGTTGWTAQMTTDLTAAFQTKAQKVYEALGLANVGQSGLIDALEEIDDTPWYESDQRRVLTASIKSKAAAGALDTASVANLQIIDGAL